MWRGLLLTGLVVLAGCIPPRRVEDIQARPTPDSVRAGGTGVMEPAPAPPVGAAPLPGPVDPGPSAVPPRVARTRPVPGRVAEPPRPIAQWAPRYPVALRDRGVEGRVVATFIVDDEGWVRDMEAQATHAAFAQAVREVLPRWRFRPARDAAGQAVAAPVRQVFRFRIGD
ncbi:MAG: TonB family protein [Pseudomonadota bacterium]|nr:TonB family protein [Pseudomonadota bacterium]